MKEVEIEIENEFVNFVIGQNSKDNFKIIDDAEKYDLWFHANSLPSCHVIVKLPEDYNFSKKQMQKIVTQGSLLCKENTNSLKSGNKIEFVYTNVENLKKGKKEGSVHFKDNNLLKYKKI